jgi:hypothetical protein
LARVKFPPLFKLDSCNCIHSGTAISTRLLLQNHRPQRRYFSGPNKGLEKVRVIARIIQTLPWKWLQRLACPKCAVWGVLQCRNLRRMVRFLAGNSLEQTSLLVAVDVPVDCLHRSMNPT